MNRNTPWSVAIVLGLLLAILPPHPRAADDPYEQGRAALDRKEWERAESLFREVAKGGGPKADDALYWRAYALGKLSRVDQALRVLDELQRKHPDSPWIDDAEALHDELRGEVAVDAKDSDLKSLALLGLVQADPERALPHLEKFLKSDRSVSDKEQALFMLLQTDHPRATEIVVGIAKDPQREPELRAAAVRSLGVAGGESSGERLGEVYRSATDMGIKRAVLDAYMVGGFDDELLAVAKSETHSELRSHAIQMLGAMGAEDALDKLAAELKGSDTRQALLQAYMVSGNGARLFEIARASRDPREREQAIQLLGAMGATQELEQLYAGEPSREVRRTLLQSFMVAGHAGPVARAARDASDPELRQEAIQLLGVMGGADELWKIYNEEKSIELKERILQAQAVGGGAGRLVSIAKSDPEPRLRRAAIAGLGISGGASPQAMTEIYQQEKTFENKRAVLQALFTGGDVKTLIAISRKETDPRLKREAVQFLAVSGSNEATEYMLELLDENEK